MANVSAALVGMQGMPGLVIFGAGEEEMGPEFGLHGTLFLRSGHAMLGTQGIQDVLWPPSYPHSGERLVLLSLRTS